MKNAYNNFKDGNVVDGLSDSLKTAKSAYDTVNATFNMASNFSSMLKKKGVNNQAF